MIRGDLFLALADHLETKVSDDRVDMNWFGFSDPDAPKCAFGHAVDCEVFQKEFGIHRPFNNSQIRLTSEHEEKMRAELGFEDGRWIPAFNRIAYVFSADLSIVGRLFSGQPGHRMREDIIRNFRQIANETKDLPLFETYVYVQKMFSNFRERWHAEGYG